jgi:hydrogenase maturation protein HypF
MPAPAHITTLLAARERMRLDVTGAVQGVGFRPLVHRLATSLSLSGFVRNTGVGATVEIEGPRAVIDDFVCRLDAALAPPARIDTRNVTQIPLRWDDDFAIAPSVDLGTQRAVLLPDLATCADCLGEIADPANRRYRYGFTTCVRCGPRYSIIESVPFDRARTVMRHFPMCAACKAEYDNPDCRRFHAETIACPQCGPTIEAWDTTGAVLARGDPALLAAAEAIRAGKIVALLGIGGFQLVLDARNDAAVRLLRARKRRPAKPFAIMVATLAAANSLAHIDDVAVGVLCGAAAPIVLLRARAAAEMLSPNVAPDNPFLGIMLPTTPLHHMLASDLGFPLVVTSGNPGDAPIVADPATALQALGGLADLFLVHDRPIARPVDDSVVRFMARRATILRCARGYAPLRLRSDTTRKSAIGLGGQQKAALAIATGGEIVLGPHIGDLDGTAARDRFAHSVIAMKTLCGTAPDMLACDTHPDYYPTRYAHRSGLPVRGVAHHLAHVVAGMLDNGIDAPVLGVAWDGTGHGGDGTVWGGEFLLVEHNGWRRVGHVRNFPLLGGDAAVREPRRSGLGALYTIFGPGIFDRNDLPPVSACNAAERRVFASMFSGGVNTPLTSSMGRLFDAVASILDLRQTISFEGEAAMAVEFAADGAANTRALAPFSITGDDGMLVADWRALLRDLLAVRQEVVAAGRLAASFHDALASLIVDVARRVGLRHVVLSGGCFQNARLTEGAVAALRADGFEAYWHHNVPPNDGGLAAGQAAWATRVPARDNL